MKALSETKWRWIQPLSEAKWRWIQLEVNSFESSTQIQLTLMPEKERE